jgi:chromosome segregation ATPase
MDREALIQELQATLQQANEERHAAQADVEDCERKLLDTRTYLQSRTSTLTNLEDQHKHVGARYQQLLSHYNSRADKADLEAIPDRLETLCRESSACLQRVQGQRAVVSQLRTEFDDAERCLAVAKDRRIKAQRKWQGIAAEIDRVNHEQAA